MRKTRLRQAKQDIEVRPFKDMAPPKDLYELLRIPSSANTRTIKQAYHKMQKICHPDVAGPEGEEMCILLNDAYDVLSNPQSRTVYDRELGKDEEVQEVATDLSPTWAWRPKEHKKKPVWTGQPRSRSMWARVKPEDRGPKHTEQKFVFVDEWACISCRNCCDISPHSFCIDAEHGRARVYTQWGNSEEYLDYAVSSCPVDCIYWVSREELQVLEHVTADKMHDEKGSLPCPMAIMQGLNIAFVDDPFDLASEFTRRMNAEKEMKAKSGQKALQAASDKFKNRITETFHHLSEALRVAGWGA